MSLPFLNPWMLWALPAVGIPVLIHLLNRHRATTIEWGAMDLLRRVMVFRSRQIRIEDILLMLLRCLVVLLAMLALARPTTRLLPAAARREAGAVIALDGSLSMTHRPGLRSRFERAVDCAGAIVGTLKPGQPLTLVVLGRTPRVALLHAALDPAAAERTLAGLVATAEPLDLDGALADLAPLAKDLKAPRRELYLVTDAQASGFRALSGKGQSVLRDIAAAGVAVHCVPAPAGHDENAAVTDLELASGALRAGAMAQFRAVVRNHGRKPREAGEATLFLDERAVDRRPVERLGPGQSASVRFCVPLGGAGAHRLTVQIEEDALALDDRCRAVIEVRQAPRVLCVDGEAMDRSDARAAPLVVKALSPTPSGASDARPVVDLIPWTGLTDARLPLYDAVVLVNVPDVAAETALALRKYVEQGGGLMIMPGRHAKSEVLNRRFLDAGVALLPAELEGDPVEDAGGTPLDLALTDHAIARPLRALPEDLLGDARCFQRLRANLKPEAATVLNLAGGAPLLLDRATGRGRTLLWTSSAERAWSNLALNPAFPIVLQQALTEMARQPHERPLAVPDRVRLPLPSLEPGAEVSVRGPDGAAMAALAVRRGGEILVESAPATAPGFYEIEAGAGERRLAVAVNVDARESDVKTLAPAEIEDAFRGLPVRILPSDGSLAAAVAASRTGRELWRGLALAGFALLMAEGFLARWYTRRT